MARVCAGARPVALDVLMELIRTNVSEGLGVGLLHRLERLVAFLGWARSFETREKGGYYDADRYLGMTGDVAIGRSFFLSRKAHYASRVNAVNQVAFFGQPSLDLALP